MHAKDRKRLESIAKANGYWHYVAPFANAMDAAEARLAEANALLREWADNTDATFAVVGARPGRMSVKTRAFLGASDNAPPTG